MIYLATDHRGFELKEKIKTWLTEWGYEFHDFGAYEYNADDDYPDFVRKAAEAVANDPEHSRGIILGGSGQGEAMVANRYKGVRAAVFYGPPFQLKKLPNWMWLLLSMGGGSDKISFHFSTIKNIIKLSREHNNANILSIGASFIDENIAKRIIKLWLDTPFSNEERHKRRIEKIDIFK